MFVFPQLLWILRLSETRWVFGQWINKHRDVYCYCPKHWIYNFFLFIKLDELCEYNDAIKQLEGRYNLIPFFYLFCECVFIVNFFFKKKKSQNCHRDYWRRRRIRRHCMGPVKAKFARHYQTKKKKDFKKFLWCLFSQPNERETCSFSEFIPEKVLRELIAILNMYIEFQSN